MEFTGKIIQILPLQKGKSAKGEWQKQDFIVETQEQYPKKVYVSVWNNKFEVKNLLKKLVKVFIDLESREYNQRWYTDVKAWKIDAIDKPSGEIQSAKSDDEKGFNDLPWENDDENGAGGLPF